MNVKLHNRVYLLIKQQSKQKFNELALLTIENLHFNRQSFLRLRDISFRLFLTPKNINYVQLDDAALSASTNLTLTLVELRLFDSFISLTATPKKKLANFFFVFIHLHFNYFDSFFSNTHKTTCWLSISRFVDSQNMWNGTVNQKKEIMTAKGEASNGKLFHRQNFFCTRDATMISGANIINIYFKFSWFRSFQKNDLHTHACFQTMMVEFLRFSATSGMNFFLLLKIFTFNPSPVAVLFMSIVRIC